MHSDRRLGGHEWLEPLSREAIEAGRKVLYSYGVLRYESPDSDALILKSIYRAMRQAQVMSLRKTEGRSPVG
jgi:hypothetical protein